MDRDLPLLTAEMFTEWLREVRAARLAADRNRRIGPDVYAAAVAEVRRIHPSDRTPMPAGGTVPENSV
jgi:hypothetical protein